MSHILFASPESEIRISGRERALMGIYLSNIPLAIYPPWLPEDEPWSRLVRPDSYLLAPSNARAWAERFRTAWQIADHHFTVNPLDVSLNTASAIGSDELRVMAWIHGQCEVHGYIEGVHRPWLAARIDRALDVGLIRRDPFGYDGWPALATWLRDDTQHPVVMSYSVCDQFPAEPPGLSDEEYEAWEEMPNSAKWVGGLDRLRAGGGNVGALDPDTIADRRYGDGRSILDLANATVTA